MPDPQPLSRARDRTHILLDTVRVHYCWATTGTPFWIILNSQWNGLLFPHILLQWSFFVWFFVWKQNQIMWFLNSNPPDGLSSHSEWNPKSFHCSMWPNMVLPQVSFRCYLQLPSPSIIFFFPTKKVSFQHLPNSQEELHVRLCAHSSFCLERSSLRHPPGSLSLLRAVLWQNVTLLGSLFQIILPKYDPSCSLWGIVFPYLVLFFFPVFFWSPNIIICLIIITLQLEWKFYKSKIFASSVHHYIPSA